jgi:flagellar biosynthetic protein FlhB
VAEEAGEKTEEATQARRDEFRKRGQVAQTRELSSAAVLLFAFFLIYFSGKYFTKQVVELFNIFLGDGILQSIAHDDLKKMTILAGKSIMELFLPIGCVLSFVSAFAVIIQIGFLQLEDPLGPNLEKIDPFNGLKRIFSLKSVVEAFKALVKIAMIGFIIYLIFKSEVIKMPKLINQPIESILNYLGTKVGLLLGSISGLFFALAMADYFFQRWDLEKQMMMTKHEVKEEHKSREGDPLIKSRIRRIQREMAQKRMMEEVPKADVIITNPTHIAVALKYNDNTPAPTLIAMGADLIAEKIKSLARENNIPVVENKPLARTIFKTMKIGQVIPRELYVAVAEVLSYVYKLKRKVLK